jgi:uroporphyrinogen decarboxylase
MQYKNEILLDLFKNKTTKRPPVWLMRQAGRILPGYREVRKSVASFKHLVKNPELIAEVTVEPLHVLDVDAAILFSDILVIPEAMGLDYEIIEKKGPVFEATISSPSDIDELVSGDEVLNQLNYVFDSIERTKREINGTNPLIGFSGAPWTLFAYMIEGGGSKTFSKARRFLYVHPEASHKMMQMLTDSIIAYLKEKVNRGCDVIQLFDSWAEMLPVHHYEEFCLPYCQQILEALADVPTIFFPKGAWFAVPLMNHMNFDALSIDWKTSPEYVREHLGDEVIIQGNIDPCLLYADPSDIEKSIHKSILRFGGRHIVNLGHGVYPDTPTEHVIQFVKAVKSFTYPQS